MANSVFGDFPTLGNLSSNSFNFGPEPMTTPAYSFDATNAGGVTGGVTNNGMLDFGMNIPTFQLGLQGLGTLGNLWGGFQATKLAKDAFNFQKDMAQKNYANSIKSYNTALTDRAIARGKVQGDSADVTQQYIDQNKL